jgi:hypothetical protein
MKLTKTKLRRLIKEELDHLLKETRVSKEAKAASDIMVRYIRDRNADVHPHDYSLETFLDEEYGVDDHVLMDWDDASLSELERRAINKEDLDLAVDDNGGLHMNNWP